MKRCQIKVQFESGKTSFFKSKKKHFYFTKSFPNGIIGCVERGFYKKITRCDCLLFLPTVSPKKRLYSEEKFIPRWRTCANDKIVHQKIYTTFTSPLSIAKAPPCFTFLDGIWNWDFRRNDQNFHLQGVFFTGTPPKSSMYKIKLKYQDWYPPKTPVSKFSKKKVPGLVPP